MTAMLVVEISCLKSSTSHIFFKQLARLRVEMYKSQCIALLPSYATWSPVFLSQLGESVCATPAGEEYPAIQNDNCMRAWG